MQTCNYTVQFTAVLTSSVTHLVLVWWCNLVTRSFGRESRRVTHDRRISSREALRSIEMSLPPRVTIFSLYNVTTFFVFVLFLLFCGDSSDPRSPTARRIWNAREAAIRQREARKKHQLHDTRVFSRISNDDPCFGIDMLKGFWKHRTSLLLRIVYFPWKQKVISNI